MYALSKLIGTVTKNRELDTMCWGRVHMALEQLPHKAISITRGNTVCEDKHDQINPLV